MIKKDSVAAEKKMDVLVDPLKQEIWSNYLTISHSTLLDREANVTQMITCPENQLTRTRLSHTHDVLWLAETVSEELDMFTRLCMAIALGHDIGHVPFGHDGERLVKNYLGKDFTHGWMGVRLLEIMGLPLEYWVAFGIEHHSDGDLKLNQVILYPEDRVRQRFCDLAAIVDDVACAVSDPIDIIREYAASDDKEMRKIAKKAKTLIEKITKKMGIQADTLEEAHQKILASFAQNLVENSRGKQGIFMSKKYLRLFKEMKSFVYEEFHSSQYILDLRAECTEKLEKVIKEVEGIIASKNFESTIGSDVETFQKQVRYNGDESLQQKVVDFICTRTDQQIFEYYDLI